MQWAAAMLVLAAAPSARATWSIVMGDSETKEVAVGTVTCLNSFDLLALVPVVVVDKGAAAVQAAGDFQGIRRPIIFEQLMMGTPPQEILDILAGLSGHESRQYGIVDTSGRMVTFTGGSTSQWAGGVVGTDGSMVYAIQGNILAGGCVVPAIEQAILNTDGDIPARLMAGMEAARQTGGDGRCSCSSSNPTGCGCPPGSFSKSGHIGTMVVARVGDRDDPVCNESGCADGNYFMKLNVPFQSSGNPDPVLQLQTLFNNWRGNLVGRPDAVQSTVVFHLGPAPPSCTTAPTMHITLLDWRGERIDVPIQSLTVTHAPESDGLSSIGGVTDNEDGTFSVAITPGTGTGTDRFTVTVDDGARPVVLMPSPTLQYLAGDMDFDEDVDLDDFAAFVGCLTGPDEPSPPPGCDSTAFARADVDDDNDVDLKDSAIFVVSFTGPVFSDCNDNNLPDECDIDCWWPCGDCDLAGCGQSFDCNTNSVPDECETDCNTNGAPDDCDVADGTSDDCNSNGVPDECEPDCDSNGIPDECDIAAFELADPQNAGACLGTTATFGVTATGALTYQWTKDGAPLSDGGNISGATTDTLVIADVSLVDEGAYACVVAAGCVQTSSAAATLTVYTPPSSTQPLSDLTKCEGEPASFIATFTGTPPPAYQWEKDTVPIPGAESNVLTIDPVTPADAGDYRCLAVNTCGLAYTNTATLTVEAAPTITDQPDDICVEVGQTAVFTVAATGQGSLWYQWLKDGFDIPGEGGWDHTTLSLTDVQPGDAGQYGVYVVSSESPTCLVYSDEATLTVGGCTLWNAAALGFAAPTGRRDSPGCVLSSAARTRTDHE